MDTGRQDSASDRQSGENSGLGTEWKLLQKEKKLETRLKREKVISLRRERGKE